MKLIGIIVLKAPTSGLGFIGNVSGIPGVLKSVAYSPFKNGIRKTDSIHHHHHHHHPEGVVYRGFCLNSSTAAVSKIVSRRWWCIESLFPGMVSMATPVPSVLADVLFVVVTGQKCMLGRIP